jgi:hypothetical protein
MNKLSLLDVAFFIAESEASPKHVGGLMICKRPARVEDRFCRRSVPGVSHLHRCPAAVQPGHSLFADGDAHLARLRIC